MSIPRLAIERPITMFMLSAVVMLIGGLSLARLPVDLMPDVSFPSITVRVGYAGVGPLEMEELVTRPIEQALSAVAGLERLESTSSEGSARVTLNLAWGTDLNEAADDIRNRLDRVRGRLPEEADAPVMFKFDASAAPIMGVGLEGDYDRVRLREIAEHDLSQRLERVPGVAAVTVEGGLRRQIHVELSKEKIRALDLPVDRVVNLLRTENQNIPLGEVDEGDRTYLVRSQGQFENLNEIRDLVVMTRTGVPVYMRDIAEIKDSTEDFRSFTRINGKPGVRLRITKQSGTNTVAIADAVRVEIAKINREMPSVTMTALDDSSIFISRSIHAVQEHALVGGCLVDADHLPLPAQPARDVHRLHVDSDLGHRHVRAALLQRLHAQHDDLRRPGARHRHDRRRLDRRAREHVPAHGARQGPDDGVDRSQRGSLVGDPRLDADAHRGLRPAALPDRRLEHHVQAALGRRHVLADDVAVRRGDDRAGALLAAAEAAAAPSRSGAVCRRGCTRGASASSTAWTRRYSHIIHIALKHRPTVLGLGTACVVAAVMILPTIGFELMPQTDEGEVRVTAELPVGTRAERAEDVAVRLEGLAKEYVSEAEDVITQAGGGGGFGPWRRREPRQHDAPARHRRTSGRARASRSPAI